jgi:hypothetical protein
MAEEARKVLRNYYKQLKAAEEYIRFIFITGISKFAKMGVFSSLNNLEDISLTTEYAEMCGLTQEEIVQYFPHCLDDTAKKMNITVSELLEKMRYYYNGFSFDKGCQTRLYNPFSTLRFFKEKDFFNFWVETGRSKVIAEYMKNKHLTVEQFRNYQISKDFAQNPGDVDATPPEGFLHQCGYLTLRDRKGDDFLLDYPNTEVLNSMSSLLVQNILYDNDHDYSRCRTELLKGLESGNHNKLIKSFNRLLASIPYDDYVKTAKEIVSDNEYDYHYREWIYRSTIVAFLRGCGVIVFAEMHSNLGRSDIVVIYCEKAWVIEVKVAYKGQCPAQKAEEALKQIKDKNYAVQYPDAVCIGMAIDDEKRQITECRVEN